MKAGAASLGVFMILLQGDMCRSVRQSPLSHRQPVGCRVEVTPAPMESGGGPT